MQKEQCTGTWSVMIPMFISRLSGRLKSMQVLIVLALIIAGANLYGLIAGISIVLPHLFYIPIILAAFFYPRRGVLFAVLVSAGYLLMVIVLRPGFMPDILSAVARCIVFIIIAAVVSFLSARVSARETELRQTKEEWERTFDAVPDLIAIIDKGHTILRINRAMADRLGISPEEAAGKRCFEVVHTTSTFPLSCPHAMLLSDGRVHTEEIHEDNLGGDFLVTASPLSDADGKLIGSVHIARDITERKRIEQAMRESEGQLQQKSRDLALKVRELNCLYEIARLVETAATTEGLLQSIADILPSAWLYPDLTCARVVVEDRIFLSAGFIESTRIGEAWIIVHGKITGKIEIFLREEGTGGRPPLPAGETDLLSAIAERVGRILERKQSEDALQQKTEELDQYFTTSLDLFCIADTNGYFRRLNRQWEKTLGYTIADLEGKRFLDFVHPDDLPVTLAAIADLRSQKEILNFTNRYRHRDGTYRWIEWRSFPKGDRIFAAACDITERKNIEEALRQSEEKYRTLVETSFDGIAIHQQGILVYVNQTAARILGSEDPGIFIGKAALDIVAPSFRERVSGRVQQASQTTLDLVREQFLRLDGTLIDVDVATAPTFWRGRPAAYVTFRDITAQVRTEEALKTALTKLNMLSSITRHDILNQIMGLRTFLELSREDLRGTRFETFIEKEDQAAEAIQRQIEFTRYYQDIGVNAPKWQDAGLVIREAVAQLSLQAVGVRVTIGGVEIFADPLIVKVFFNLMENSLRHGERVTGMEFSSRESGTGLVITYRDNGVGISAEDKKKLFQKGFGKHTGLGLFLSREILAITGITITENGKPGSGVQFEITVPAGAFRFLSSKPVTVPY